MRISAEEDSATFVQEYESRRIWVDTGDPSDFEPMTLNGNEGNIDLR